MIVRTMRSEFPYYGIMMLAGELDTLFLHPMNQSCPTRKYLPNLQASIASDPLIRGDVHAWFGQTDLRWVLLNNYLLGKEQLDRLVDKSQSQVINTDQNLKLEFTRRCGSSAITSPETLAMKALPKAAEPNSSTLGHATSRCHEFAQRHRGLLRQARQQLAETGVEPGVRDVATRIGLPGSACNRRSTGTRWPRLWSRRIRTHRSAFKRETDGRREDRSRSRSCNNSSSSIRRMPNHWRCWASTWAAADITKRSSTTSRHSSCAQTCPTARATICGRTISPGPLPPAPTPRLRNGAEAVRWARCPGGGRPERLAGARYAGGRPGRIGQVFRGDRGF